MKDPITPEKVRELELRAEELENEVEYLDKKNLLLQKVINEKISIIEKLEANQQQPARNY